MGIPGRITGAQTWCPGPAARRPPAALRLCWNLASVSSPFISGGSDSKGVFALSFPMGPYLLQKDPMYEPCFAFGPNAKQGSYIGGALLILGLSEFHIPGFPGLKEC